MTIAGIADRRLSAQHLSGDPFDLAVEAVAWFGAIQAQDHAGAKWALGQRTRSVTDADLDRVLDAGAILRTHVLRPTWHFVLPADIRWVLALTASRVRIAMTSGDRHLEIDRALVRASNDVIEGALRGGSALTRDELGSRLDRAGIPARGQRLANLLMHAELDGIVSSGPRRDARATYALLDERAPFVRALDREEALAELTRRYFSSHGPAQARDFAWWSGLTLADARRGIALSTAALAHEVMAGTSYWSSPVAPAPVEPGPLVHLLPNYDEFLVAYQDRSAVLDPARGFDLAALPNGSLLANVVVLNGQVWGGWKRRRHGRQVIVELGPLDALGARERAALADAAERFSRFLDLPVALAGPQGADPA